MGKPQPKIAVIGPSQSGKTCLAAGLYNVRRPRLAVSAPNREIKAYLDARTKELRKGDWPAATVPGTLEDIPLDFHARGASSRVSFIEFAGELLTKDETFIPFANEHFRGLDGVVLLVNPGADDFSSQERFSECLSQYRRILGFLGDPNNGAKPSVALVVAAADRLQGDLQDGKATDHFRECREDIESELANRGFDWETFEVTITGHLENQEKPKLARGSEITAAEPFLWLVDRITDYPERVKKRKRRAIIAAVAAIFALTGWYWWLLVQIHAEGQQLESCKEALTECLSNWPPDGMVLEKAMDAMTMLRTNRWSDANINEVEGLVASNAAYMASACCEVAIRRNNNPKEQARNLEELAKLLRDETITGEENKTRLKDAYDIAYGRYIDEMAGEIVQHRDLPANEDDRAIRQKSIEVGPPFDAIVALDDLRKRVEELADPQRAACHKWVRENIRPSTPRTGKNGLLREYVKARDGELQGNHFCNDLVRRNVYDQYGRWLGEDVTNYPSKVTVALFDGKKEARENFEKWLGQFRDTCRELAGTDDPDPDKSSWAYQFAKRSMEEDRFPDVALDAFPQTFAVTRIDCRVDYGGKFPVNHKRTSFKASLRILDPATWKPGKPIPIFNGGDIREKDEKKWVTVWTNGFKHTGGLFTMALHLDAVDEQNWISIAGTIGGSSDETFPLADDPIAALKLHKAKDEQDCWEFDQEFELGRATGADKVRFTVRVYGKLERKTPGSLARDLSKEEWRLPPQDGGAR